MDMSFFIYLNRKTGDTVVMCTNSPIGIIGLAVDKCNYSHHVHTPSSLMANYRHISPFREGMDYEVFYKELRFMLTAQAVEAFDENRLISSIRWDGYEHIGPYDPEYTDLKGAIQALRDTGTYADLIPDNEVDEVIENVISKKFGRTITASILHAVKESRNQAKKTTEKIMEEEGIVTH